MAKSKAVARGYVWWPNIDSDIEKMIRRCQGCQETASAPAATPLHRWEYPARAWQRLYIDFAGPFQGRMYLLLVDAFSKWPEIVEMKSTSAEDTIDELRAIFARFGLPEQIVSDNGPQFTSEAFQKFTSRNGIRHVTGAPYHPATNGIAERLVRSFKRAMKADTSARSHRTKLSRFLLEYAAPHSRISRTAHRATNCTAAAAKTKGRRGSRNRDTCSKQDKLTRESGARRASDTSGRRYL